MQDRPLISIHVPCCNEAEAFRYLEQTLRDLSNQITAKYAVEIVVVNDGSHDGTWESMRDFARQDSRVVAVCFSSNFSQQFVLTPGNDSARGDAIVCVDAGRPQI